KYSEIPSSLKNVLNGFENGRIMFFTGLHESLSNRKKIPFDRYIDIGRVVFGFFEEIYQYQEQLTIKDKIMFAVGKNDLKHWENFLEEVLKKIKKFNAPCNCKIEKNIFSEEYEKVFSLLAEIKDFQYLSNHFMKKIQQKEHPFMTGYLIGFFREELEIKELVFPFLVLESIIHGIDDYVDISKRGEKEYRADIFNVVFGFFSLVFYLFKSVKIDKNDLFRLLIGKKSKLQEFIDSLFFSLIELSNVPEIEKKTENILKMNQREEMGLAVKNMRTRAAGINIFLILTSYLLGKSEETEFKHLSLLIKDYRIVELLEKDIKDIHTDLKNKDYTPVCIWWKKYKKEIFCEKIRTLASIFYREAEIESNKIKKYKKIKQLFFNGVKEKVEKISNC
ncbi:MAG: hypothetical protein DRP18_04765, partial [Candidatus Aenigmatarchaeota archaeon]